MHTDKETVEVLEQQLRIALCDGTTVEVADIAVRAVWKLLLLCRRLRAENDVLRGESAKAA